MGFVELPAIASRTRSIAIRRWPTSRRRSR